MTRYSSVEIDFIADEPGPLVAAAHPTREVAPQPRKVSMSHNRILGAVCGFLAAGVFFVALQPGPAQASFHVIQTAGASYVRVKGGLCGASSIQWCKDGCKRKHKGTYEECYQRCLKGLECPDGLK
jgi:hypothetical protein